MGPVGSRVVVTSEIDCEVAPAREGGVAAQPTRMIFTGGHGREGPGRSVGLREPACHIMSDGRDRTKVPAAPGDHLGLRKTRGGSPQSLATVWGGKLEIVMVRIGARRTRI